MAVRYAASMLLRYVKCAGAADRVCAAGASVRLSGALLGFRVGSRFRLFAREECIDLRRCHTVEYPRARRSRWCSDALFVRELFVNRSGTVEGLNA